MVPSKIGKMHKNECLEVVLWTPVQRFLQFCSLKAKHQFTNTATTATTAGSYTLYHSYGSQKHFPYKLN